MMVKGNSGHTSPVTSVRSTMVQTARSVARLHCLKALISAPRHSPATACHEMVKDYHSPATVRFMVARFVTLTANNAFDARALTNR